MNNNNITNTGSIAHASTAEPNARTNVERYKKRRAGVSVSAATDANMTAPLANDGTANLLRSARPPIIVRPGEQRCIGNLSSRGEVATALFQA